MGHVIGGRSLQRGTWRGHAGEGKAPAALGMPLEGSGMCYLWPCAISTSTCLPSFFVFWRTLGPDRALGSNCPVPCHIEPPPSARAPGSCGQLPFSCALPTDLRATVSVCPCWGGHLHFPLQTAQKMRKRGAVRIDLLHTNLGIFKSDQWQHCMHLCTVCHTAFYLHH